MSENKQLGISVVIAAWNGIARLRECLASLENQIERGAAEIIVVSNFESRMLENKTAFPFVKFFTLPPDTTVPQLRARGIIEASSAVIALTEDACILDSGWAREIEKAHELPYAVIGGGVENTGAQSALDWAVYFYDYGKYMLPNRAGVTDALSGMNVSYKREILEEIRKNYENGFFEFFVNEEFKKRGHKLYLTPTAIVRHNKNYDLKKTVFQFYHQARSFAARRVFYASVSKRLLFIAASLILPILLSTRVVLRTIRKGNHFKELIISLPFLTILMSVWAFGEFCGYLKGEGQSSREWR